MCRDSISRTFESCFEDDGDNVKIQLGGFGRLNVSPSDYRQMLWGSDGVNLFGQTMDDREYVWENWWTVNRHKVIIKLWLILISYVLDFNIQIEKSQLVAERYVITFQENVCFCASGEINIL